MKKKTPEVPKGPPSDIICRIICPCKPDRLTEHEGRRVIGINTLSGNQHFPSEMRDNDSPFWFCFTSCFKFKFEVIGETGYVRERHLPRIERETHGPRDSVEDPGDQG